MCLECVLCLCVHEPCGVCACIALCVVRCNNSVIIICVVCACPVHSCVVVYLALFSQHKLTGDCSIISVLVYLLRVTSACHSVCNRC